MSLAGELAARAAQGKGGVIRDTCVDLDHRVLAEPSEVIAVAAGLEGLEIE